MSDAETGVRASRCPRVAWSESYGLLIAWTQLPDGHHLWQYSDGMIHGTKLPDDAVHMVQEGFSVAEMRGDG